MQVCTMELRTDTIDSELGPIVIPCHRVIGSNAALTGYGGGLPRKQWLLRHEGALL